MGDKREVSCQGGKLTVTVPFREKVCYDAGNNRITAQFDGRGGMRS